MQRSIALVLFALAASQGFAQGQPADPAPGPGGLQVPSAAGPGTEPIADLDYAQVRRVVARESPDGSWRFDVTVEHRDEGWDHYADLWQVVHPETLELYGERVLLHPHDNEQPFTRSQSGIVIPDGQTLVLVRARCQVHGFGGGGVLVDLSTSSGNGYEVR